MKLLLIVMVLSLVGCVERQPCVSAHPEGSIVTHKVTGKKMMVISDNCTQGNGYLVRYETNFGEVDTLFLKPYEIE